MNAQTIVRRLNIRRRRAVALITVLSVLALILVLLTALLSSTRVEYNSTVVQVEGAKARLHGDSAINLAISQLQRAAHQDADVGGVEIWSSQPGMVRQYRESGLLLRGLKLYSDSKMVATSEAEIAADTPPADWDQRPAQYVDLNEPVVRRNAASPNAPPRLYFPVIDPRAYSTNATRSVEGFSYSLYADGVSGQALAGVVAPSSDGDGNLQRLPMPVEWLYMLQDGTLGFVDDDGKFVGPNGAEATRENPIVSRLAFWTDDESSKININTAGEGTLWDTPRLYHERDGEWAQYQPMAYEYQRYPGHPASVCMSTVLYPGQNMNPLTSETTDFAKALKYKEAIYELMPKLLPGGSRAGSVLVPVNREFTPTDFKEVQKALGERLFPSVDEFLLHATGSGDAGRDEIDLGVGQLWTGLETYEVIERLRPFLTPRSRAPETNPFGYPKISMWPLHQVSFADYRTVFDRTIAYCSQLAGKDYFFTRQDSTSQTELTDIARNQQLFDYLMTLTSEPIPGFGAANASFATKYGDNRQQILVEIFDYIRSTNLYDENLAEANLGTDAPNLGGGLPNARGTAMTTRLASKTFTPIRRSNGNSGVGSFPGHGQVTPTLLQSGAQSYRGMGRFLTVSEVGLHFIACAEGTNQAGGVAVPKQDFGGNAPDGTVMPNWRGGVWGNATHWYANFPPLNARWRDPANGFYKRNYPQNHQVEGKDGDSPEHPGYNPLNWNWTLDRNTPLADGVKRVQATFLLEWFCPAAGWTLINPNLAVEVDASALSVGGKPMFPFDGGKTLIRPYKHMSKANSVSQRGGTIAYRAFLQERKLPPVAKNVNGHTAGTLRFGDSRDPDGANTAYGSFNNRPGVLQQCNQYNLVSDFFDVPAGGAIPFSGGTVMIKILDNDDTSKVLQTINVDFPAAQFPAPLLVTSNEDASWTQNANGNWVVNHPTAAPYWWAFHADGALGRDLNGRISAEAVAAQSEMGGRFRYVGEKVNYGANRYFRGNFAVQDDTLQSLLLGHADPRLIMGRHEVPDSEFTPHRHYGSRRMAHNMVMQDDSFGPGIDIGNDVRNLRLVKGGRYRNVHLPDTGYSAAAAQAMHKYGDFDRGVSDQSDGAYINKPDEGNTFSRLQEATGEQLVPYFTQPNTDWSGTSTYFSPNRQVASPGKFGSLPTGVLPSGGASGQEAWRTLLFRPQTWSTKMEQQPHIGAPKRLMGYGSGTGGWPVNGMDPPDYLFMDFFWMPVVEPYAISEPGSTAGKINLNYQMAPFRHIRRATGLASVLKSELLTAVSVADIGDYLRRPPGGTGERQTWFWREDSSASGGKFWHRQMDTEATLKLFDERFRSGFAFISPAQICEMYLLPKKTSNADTLVPAAWPTQLTDLLKSSSSASILRFWENHALTADNLKERPYTNLYPRLTTRSNTYQLHMRVQTVNKARSADPAKFVVGTDSIGSEYRGSVVLERYLDLNDPALSPAKDLDYASGAVLTKPPLENLHRFRIIAQKRFDP